MRALRGAFGVSGAFALVSVSRKYVQFTRGGCLPGKKGSWPPTFPKFPTPYPPQWLGVPLTKGLHKVTDNGSHKRLKPWAGLVTNNGREWECP